MKYRLNGHIASARLGKTKKHVQSSQSLAFIKIKSGAYYRMPVHLAGSNYGISQDFPREIVEIRKGLIKAMKEAKKEGHDTKLVYDKLYINGRRYRPQP